MHAIHAMTLRLYEWFFIVKKTFDVFSLGKKTYVIISHNFGITFSVGFLVQRGIKEKYDIVMEQFP